MEFLNKKGKLQVLREAMRYFKYITINILLFLSSYSVYAWDEINTINQVDKRLAIDFSYAISNDDSGTNDIKSIKALDYKLANPGVYKRGVSDTKMYFVHFVLKNEGQENTFYLDFQNVHISDIDIYEVDGGEVTKRHVDFLIPFVVTLPKHHERHFYIKIRDKKVQYALLPSIISISEHTNLKNQKLVYDGLFYGGLIFVLIYNFVLFVTIRRKYLLFYTLYILFFGIFQFSFDGGLITLFPSVSSHVDSLVLAQNTFLAYVFNFFFLISFLSVKVHFPRFSKTIHAYIAFLLGLVILAIVPKFGIVVLGLIDYVAPISMLIILTLSIMSYRKKVVNSNLILLSYVWIITAGIFTVLAFNRVVPGYEFKDYILKVGLFGELILLSFAASSAIYKHQVSLQERISDELENSKTINTELTLAKKEIEKTSIIKDQFMVNISHELRTPMNAVLGFTNLLENLDNLPQEAVEQTHNLKISASALMNAVEDILDFKQLTNNTLELENRSFFLKQLIDQTLLSYKYEAESKGLIFKSEITPSIGNYFVGDKKKIKKLFSIVLHNAVKFTRKGEVSFTIDVKETKGNVYIFTVNIVDTGVGIPKDKVGLIFDTFSQVDQEYTREYGGIGMGLALFKKIIELMGGQYSIKSNLDEGTEFYFEFPLSLSSASALTRQNLNVEGANDIFSKKNKILLVEDDPINILIAKKFLQKISTKLEVLVAENGEEAIETLELNQIDLILMDIQMPTMDGYEATRIIRNELSIEVSKIPIIAVTAHALESEKLKCMQFGMNDFLSKPYTQEDLEKLLVKYLNEDDSLYLQQLENLY